MKKIWEWIKKAPRWLWLVAVGIGAVLFFWRKYFKWPVLVHQKSKPPIPTRTEAERNRERERIEEHRDSVNTSVDRDVDAEIDSIRDKFDNP